MLKVTLISLVTLMSSDLSHAAERTAKYSGVAHAAKGPSAYEELHEVTFNDQRVQRAKTKYLDPKGQLIGEMSSNFTKKITIPDYDYKDLRTGSSHGIRIDGAKITLWRKDKDGDIKTSDFYESQFPKETLLVGCQGLHYYLVENLDMIKAKKTIPIAYFIPGKLDYYKFTLKLDSEDDKYIYIKISIDNFFLRLFTSSLDLKYGKSERRLVQYSGLSNITNDKDQLQNVVIDYKYD